MRGFIWSVPIDFAQAPNAPHQLLPEAVAQRRLSAVSCTPLRLLEVPSSADHGGMLALGKHARERRTPQAMRPQAAPVFWWHRLARSDEVCLSP
jgi:hypothetical protein